MEDFTAALQTSKFKACITQHHSWKFHQAPAFSTSLDLLPSCWLFLFPSFAFLSLHHLSPWLPLNSPTVCSPPVMQSSLALHILYSHTVPNSLFRQHANEVGPIFGRWFVYSCSTDALTQNSQSSSCSSSEKVRVVSTRAPKLLVNLSKLHTTRLHVSMKRSVDTHKHSILEITSQNFAFFL